MVDHTSLYLIDFTSNLQSYAFSGKQHPYFDSPFLNKSDILLHVGRTSYVCNLVFTTSSGLVSIPAIPPEIPAHRKYQASGF